MATDSESYILRRLDDPWKLGLWELDTALPFSICVFLGMLRGTGFGLFAGFALGLLAGRLVGKIRASRHPGFFKHLMYWFLPADLYRTSALPPSDQQEMIG